MKHDVEVFEVRDPDGRLRLATIRSGDAARAMRVKDEAKAFVDAVWRNEGVHCVIDVHDRRAVVHPKAASLANVDVG